MAIDPQNEKTIWAGTGESNMRNSVSYGAGIYKTTDAGDNWQLMGLDSTEHISKIAIDAKISNTVYVASPARYGAIALTGDYTKQLMVAKHGIKFYLVIIKPAVPM
nr:hypothetical protein [Bacteroidota bacterium]